MKTLRLKDNRDNRNHNQRSLAKIKFFKQKYINVSDVDLIKLELFMDLLEEKIDV